MCKKDPVAAKDVTFDLNDNSTAFRGGVKEAAAKEELTWGGCSKVFTPQSQYSAH